MAANTKIEWCDHTFNPWRGCSKVSPGCANCYAEAMSRRIPALLGTWGDASKRVKANKMWSQPFKWHEMAGRGECIPCKATGYVTSTRTDALITRTDAFKCHGCDGTGFAKPGFRPKVFCGSMCDVFEDRPELVEWRAKLLVTIYETSNLDWLLLTKRPENVKRLWEESVTDKRLKDTAYLYGIDLDALHLAAGWENAWFGASIESQDVVDERIQHLVGLPVRFRFLSCEPLLGDIHIQEWLELGLIDWVIVGGESGPHARPMQPSWARSVRDQCAITETPFFFKQWGEHNQDMVRVGKRDAGRVLDGLTWDEMPEVAYA